MLKRKQMLKYTENNGDFFVLNMASTTPAYSQKRMSTQKAQKIEQPGEVVTRLRER